MTQLDDKHDGDLPGMLGVAKGIAEQRWPHTMDAATWAAEFMKFPPSEVTYDLMLGWFANAIMAGYDTAQARAASSATPPREELRRLADEEVKRHQERGEFARAGAVVDFELRIEHLFAPSHEKARGYHFERDDSDVLPRVKTVINAEAAQHDLRGGLRDAVAPAVAAPSSIEARIATPRTDALLARMQQSAEKTDDHRRLLEMATEHSTAWIDHARQLERDLAEANALVVKYSQYEEEADARAEAAVSATRDSILTEACEAIKALIKLGVSEHGQGVEHGLEKAVAAVSALRRSDGKAP
jgi:hypothetical protein